jgi:hypothetical protein
MSLPPREREANERARFAVDRAIYFRRAASSRDCSVASRRADAPSTDGEPPSVLLRRAPRRSPRGSTSVDASSGHVPPTVVRRPSTRHRSPSTAVLPPSRMVRLESTSALGPPRSVRAPSTSTADDAISALPPSTAHVGPSRRLLHEARTTRFEALPTGGGAATATPSSPAAFPRSRRGARARHAPVRPSRRASRSCRRRSTACAASCGVAAAAPI